MDNNRYNCNTVYIGINGVYDLHGTCVRVGYYYYCFTR